MESKKRTFLGYVKYKCKKYTDQIVCFLYAIWVVYSLIWLFNITIIRSTGYIIWGIPVYILVGTLVFIIIKDIYDDYNTYKSRCRIKYDKSKVIK